MTSLCIVRPSPGWNKLRFNLATGAVEVPADSPVGLSAFGEGVWILGPGDRAALDAVTPGAATAAPGAVIAAGGASLIAVALATAEAEAAEAALREALARGATRAILITGAEDADSSVAAGALVALIRRMPAGEAPDLIVLGAEMPNGAPDELAPMLAEALGWAGITAATTLAPAPGAPDRLQADQVWVAGRRTVTLARPAVISLLPDAAVPPRYPPAAAVLAAFRRQQIERVALADLDLPAGRAPRVVVRRAALAEAPPVERLAGPVEESVAVLLGGLRELQS